jgi:hypothetical protein
MHRASTALRNTATKFGSRQPQLFPNHPQQRHFGFYVNVVVSAVYVQTQHGIPYLNNLSDYRPK